MMANGGLDHEAVFFVISDALGLGHGLGPNSWFQQKKGRHFVREPTNYGFKVCDTLVQVTTYKPTRH